MNSINNTRDKIILVSNQLNSACQALGLLPPKRIELAFATQIIPTIIIGKCHFFSPNWLCSKDEKLVRLLEHVLSKLNEPNFIENHLEELKGTPLIFQSVFCSDAVQPHLKIVTHVFE